LGHAFLTEAERIQLKGQHKKERDKRICDRIKAVLLSDKGWKPSKISEVLMLDEVTIYRHIEDYKDFRKLKPENGGSTEKLTDEQCQALEKHLEASTFTKTKEICAYVKAQFEAEYTVAGMHSWLAAHKFVYKKPKGIPAKADKALQEAFIEAYEALKTSTPFSEPILFMDSSHPTQETRLTYGWIRKGKDKLIPTTASRTRVNITGAINLNEMKLVSNTYKTIDSDAIEDFLKRTEASYPMAERIHVFCDQAGYHRSEQIKRYLTHSRITLHYLPTYSPNLNPIERLWKVMHEYVSNNHYFKTAKEFRDKIDEFLTITFNQITSRLRSTITDNFQTLGLAPSG
jgi:transposase